MPGQAVRLLDDFGRRYAVAVRVSTLPPIAAIAFLRASAAELTATALVAAAAVTWTCAQGFWLRRTGNALLAADAAVLVTLCASVFVTDAVDETNTGWLRLLVTVACVTWQWHTPPVAGVLAALITGGSMLAVFAAAGFRLDAAQVWVLAMAVMSRAAWILVTRAAERADRLAEASARARRAAAVAAGVRAGERELANSLHDTAASTLLMVGTGQVRDDASWLAPQARRDLAQLRSATERRVPERADLIDLLRADLELGHLDVDLTAPPELPLPFEVATAVAGAVREALNNVRRHAGTDRALVRVREDAGGLRVEVTDEGAGFAVDDQAPSTRRGLRESVHGRLAGVGGSAAVTSAPGAGTVVRLEWRPR